MADTAVFGVAELRTLILSFIDEPKDVRRLERVSKGFLHSLSDIYWAKVTKLSVSVVTRDASGPFYKLNDVDGFTFEAVTIAIKWLLKRAGRLDRVQLSCSLMVPQAQRQMDAILSVVAENASSLTRLALGAHFLSRHNLCMIVRQNAATLQHVDIESNYNQCNSIPWLPYHSPQCSRSKYYQCNSVAGLPYNGPQCTSGNYNRCEPIPGSMLRHLIPQCSSLRHVRLAALHGGYPLLEALRTLPNLDSVELKMNYITPQQVLYCLDGLAIRSLTLVGPHRKDSALSVGPCRQLPQLSRLRLVDLCDNSMRQVYRFSLRHDVHDNSMNNHGDSTMPTALLSHCPRLSWLRVELNLHQFSGVHPMSFCRYMVNWLQNDSTCGVRPSLLRVELGALPSKRPAPLLGSLAAHFESVRQEVDKRLRLNATASQDPCRRLATFHYNDHTLELTCDDDI